MHPLHSLFTDEPETEYVPDILGRIGQGETVVKPDPEPIGTPSPRFNEFNKAEQSGMGLRDLFGANPFAIKGPVGPTAPNRRADVGKVETFMSRSGNFDLSPTDGPDGLLRSAPRRRDQRLPEGQRAQNRRAGQTLRRDHQDAGEHAERPAQTAEQACTNPEIRCPTYAARSRRGTGNRAGQVPSRRWPTPHCCPRDPRTFRRARSRHRAAGAA